MFITARCRVVTELNETPASPFSVTPGARTRRVP
jgi:hypothetical protein